MTPRCNPLVGAVTTPPVAEARAWIRGRTFPADKELLDLAQAVPSYAPAEALMRHVATLAHQPATSVYSDILGTPGLRTAFARHLHAWRDAKVRLVQERMGAMRRAFAHSNLSYRLISYGAYFAYVRHPFRGTSAVAVARGLVERENVLCLPGSFFGPRQEDYLRLAFANVESNRFGELVDRLLQSQSDL